MRRLILLMVMILLVGCSHRAQVPSNGIPPAVQSKTLSQPLPSVPVVMDGPVPAPPEFPPPAISVPQPPYAEHVPHPLPTDTVDVIRVQQAVEEEAKGWNVPGKFHVNSLWQITGDLQLASGYYDGVLTMGVVTLPIQDTPAFFGLYRIGGGGPATIVGVKGDWVLLRAGLSYQVFNYVTHESNVSDETATPGKYTIMRGPHP